MGYDQTDSLSEQDTRADIESLWKGDKRGA